MLDYYAFIVESFCLKLARYSFDYREDSRSTIVETFFQILSKPSTLVERKPSTIVEGNFRLRSRKKPSTI